MGELRIKGTVCHIETTNGKLTEVGIQVFPPWFRDGPEIPEVGESATLTLFRRAPEEEESTDGI